MAFDQKFTTETVREVWWDEDTTCHMRIGPDPDGLSCVQLSYINHENKETSIHFPAMPPEQAFQVGKAIIACGNEILKV